MHVSRAAVLVIAVWFEEDVAPAEAPGSLPRRFIALEFGDPVDDAEANAQLWFSLNQIFGRVSDQLAAQRGLDDHVAKRLGQFLVLGHLNLAIGYYSHEWGHARVGRALGPYEWWIDLTEWFILGFPAYRARLSYKPTAVEDLCAVVAGLNQEEFDAYVIHRKALEEITFDEGFAFICRKLSDVTYDVYGSWSPTGDVSRYKRNLGLMGIHLSDQAFLAQAALADLLSVKLWDSFRAVGNYLAKGERTTECTTLKLRGVEITPPLVNFYMTPDGGFYNLVSFVNPAGRNPIELAVGTDVDFIGDGRLDCLRIGGKYCDIKPWDTEPAPRISIFAYLDVNRSDRARRGYSAGIEVSYPAADRLALTARIEYSDDDVVENVVKGKGSGSRFTAGLSWRF